MPVRLVPSTRTPIRLTLGTLAAYAFTRGLAYAIPGRSVQDPLQQASMGGALIPAYITAWIIAGTLCLWDMRRPTITGWGPRAVIGMMLLWAAAYALGWAHALLRTGESLLWWQTAFTYGAPAVALIGLLAIVRSILHTVAEVFARQDGGTHG